jgi:hypothetical protein
VPTTPKLKEIASSSLMLVLRSRIECYHLLLKASIGDELTIPFDLRVVGTAGRFFEKSDCCEDFLTLGDCETVTVRSPVCCLIYVSI